MMFCAASVTIAFPPICPPVKLPVPPKIVSSIVIQDPLLGCEVAANRDRISRIALDTPATVRSDKSLKKAADRNTGRFKVNVASEPTVPPPLPSFRVEMPKTASP